MPKIANPEVWVQRNVDRFWSQVQVAGPDDCWIWTGWRGRYEHGRTWFVDRMYQSTHVAYMLTVGPVPEGLELDHLCKNPPCVNPAHLEPVTHRVNVDRSDSISIKNAAKTHCPQGHPYAGHNLKFNSVGGRICRTCLNDKRRARRRLHGRDHW